MWDLATIVPLLMAGGFAGIIAGMFGVGGGTILVPLVLWILQVNHADNTPYSQHIAVGTSFAVMVFTSFSSAYSQHKAKAVDWQILRHMAPGVLFGVVVGSMIARFLSKEGLEIFFIIFISVIAVRTLMNIKPTPSRQLPGGKGLFEAGALFGVLSSWIGIGGGSLTVPFLTFCNVSVHRAIGTSAVLGWPIALAGALSYWYAGYDFAGLPPGVSGFTYWPVVIILAVATIIGAPIGVRISHRLPVDKLKKSFGILLLLIALRMVFKMFQ